MDQVCEPASATALPTVAAVEAARALFQICTDSWLPAPGTSTSLDAPVEVKTAERIAEPLLPFTFNAVLFV